MFPKFYLCLIFFLAGCATTTPLAVQKKEPIVMDSKEEVLLGRSMAENIIKAKIPLLNDPAKQLYVNRIGNRMAQVSDRRDIIYHFIVLDSPDLNAFALPGGYVYVTRGLLDKLDESELAALLAHELGHLSLKHPVKKMQSTLGDEFLMALALFDFTQKDPLFAQQINSASKTVFDLLSRGYSQEEEVSADRLALTYLERVGYDPLGLVRVLGILKKETGPKGRVFETLSDRSRLEARIRRVKEDIKDLGKITHE